MRTYYDPEADALAIELWPERRPAEARTLGFGGLTVDVAEDGTVIALEILGASKRYPAEILEAMPEAPETDIPASMPLPEDMVPMSLAEAAAIAGVSTRALRKACERGRLGGWKLGHDWAISRRALDEYLESRLHAGPGSASG